jgi:hypothetical protein
MDLVPRTGWRARTGAAVVALVSVTATVVVETPAQAVPSPIRVQDSTPVTSEDSMTGIATCPAGTKTYGGSAEVVIDSGAAGSVVLDDIRPNTSLTRIVASAYEIGSFAGTWHLVVYAICGPAVADMQLVVARTARSFSPQQVVTATCPTGTSIYGGGGGLNFGRGDVYIERMALVGTDRMTVAGRTNLTLDRAWQVSAYAICGAPSSFMISIFAVGPISSASPQESVATPCPPGLKIHGVGAEILLGDGNIFIEDIAVNAALTQVRVRAYERPATSVGWRLTAMALCST